jgi:hypothetical protein
LVCYEELLNNWLSAQCRQEEIMIKRTKLFVFTIIISLSICACATPTTKRVKVDDVLAEMEAKKQREIALEAWYQDQVKLYNVAYGIFTKSVPLCNETTTHHIGIHIANKYMFSEDMQEAVFSLFKISNVPKIIHVVKGSAAEQSGIKENDVLVAINDWAVPIGKDSHTEFLEKLKDVAEKNPQISIKVLRDGIEKTFEIKPDKACDYNILLANDDNINAFADGKSVIITRGMIRYTKDDTELALVISHELAHNVMKHIEAKTKNFLLGAIFDVIAAFLGVNTQGVFSQIGSQAYSKEFEEEADYVGLYIMALGGLDIENAPNFWRRMAAVHPNSISYETTHPSTPHRFVLLEKTVQEIKQKISSNLPLTPELKKEKHN